MANTLKTKKPSRVRNYVFTINNPNGKHFEMLHNLYDCGIASYVLFQLEIGEESKTEHFQGHLELTKGMTISALQKQTGEFKFGFLAPCVDREKSIKYVTKGKTKVAGPWSFGEPKIQGYRTDLQEVCEMIKNGTSFKTIAEEYPMQIVRYGRGFKELKSLLTEDRVGWKPFLTVIKGSPGRGKSKFIYDNHDSKSIYCKSAKTVWWDGYDGHTVAVINEFGPKSPITMEELNELIDYYPCQVQIKHGSANFVARHVYITTNHAPSDWWTGDMSSFWRRVDRYIDMDKELPPEDKKSPPQLQ